jgi:hypothetical protein
VGSGRARADPDRADAVAHAEALADHSPSVTGIARVELALERRREAARASAGAHQRCAVAALLGKSPSLEETFATLRRCVAPNRRHDAARRLRLLYERRARRSRAQLHERPSCG